MSSLDDERRRLEHDWRLKFALSLFYLGGGVWIGALFLNRFATGSILGIPAETFAFDAFLLGVLCFLGGALSHGRWRADLRRSRKVVEERLWQTRREILQNPATVGSSFDYEKLARDLQPQLHSERLLSEARTIGQLQQEVDEYLKRRDKLSSFDAQRLKQLTDTLLAREKSFVELVRSGGKTRWRDQPIRIKVRIFALLAFVAALAAMVFSVRNVAYVNKEIQSEIFHYTLLPSIVFGFWLMFRLLPRLREKGAVAKPIKFPFSDAHPAIRQPIHGFLALFFGAMLAMTPIFFLEVLIDQLSTEPYTVPATVSYRHRPLRKGQSIKLIDADDKEYSIYLSSVDWSEPLEKGQRVNVVGRRGSLGFAVDRIEQLETTSKPPRHRE